MTGNEAGRRGACDTPPTLITTRRDIPHHDQEPRYPLSPGTTNAGGLSALAKRLVGHAETIRNPAAAKAMGGDLREAARVIERLQTGIEDAIRQTKDDDTRTRLTKLLGGA